MTTPVIEFPRYGAEFKWFEILDDSLNGSLIVKGSVVECYLEKTLQSPATPYALLVQNRLIIRYAFPQGPLVALVSSNPNFPTIYANTEATKVIGRVIRYFHKGKWSVIDESLAPPTDGDGWLWWAIQEAS